MNTLYNTRVCVVRESNFFNPSRFVASEMKVRNGIYHKETWGTKICANIFLMQANISRYYTAQK